jgi:hypothetical protein
LGVPLFRSRELTTVATTTMTTVGLPDTSTYATVELASCLVMPSARAYGSEGEGFESFRARIGQRRFPGREAARLRGPLADPYLTHPAWRVQSASASPGFTKQR